MRNRILSIVIVFSCLFSTFQVNAQVVTTDPAIPTADQALTITLNANGTGLEGYTGEVFAHTGLTVNGNQWQYVIGSWGNNTNQPLLTNIGTDLYELELEPTVRDFYGAPFSDVITEICIVFRSADASQQTSPDIFIEVFELGLNVTLVSPDQTPYFVDPGESIEVVAEASFAETIYLYVDDNLITSVPGNSLTHTLTADTQTNSKHWIKVVASDGTSEMADSTYYYVRGTCEIAPLPPGVVDGINYIDNQTVTLVLHAPLKNSIFAGGDFSDWQVDPEFAMKRNTQDPQDSETRYWVTITGLNPGQEYAYVYLVDETFVISDPYSEKILDPWNDSYIPEDTYPNLKPYPEQADFLGLLTILQTNQEPYNWQNTAFEAPDVSDLVIYELLIRDFVEKMNYQSLIDTLSYLKTLGVNAIELMPVNEFDGNLSWGYNPNHYFAVDKAYGTKDKLKEFIDVCHGEGIAVILDVVYNHATGISPYVQLYWDIENNRPAEDSPFYNPVPKHDFNVFNDMNHGTEATVNYISRNIKFWLEEFKVDGYRLDLSKGFTQNNTLGNPGAMAQYDQSRIDILKRYADSAWSVNPNTYFILEHFADNSEEKVLSNDGMMIWGNSNYNYNEATMGWHSGSQSDFSWISYQQRGWDDPHVIGYMESHDEERLMAKNINYGNVSGSYNIKDTTIALERQQMAAAFFYTIPGPKMIWQFGEVGYDFHINYPGVIGEDDYRTDQKPIRWDYPNDYRRKALYNVNRELIKLKKEEPAFSTDDFSLSVNDALKKIHLNHSSMNLVVLGNFDVVHGDINPSFQHTGYWYDFFGGDSIDVANVNATIELDAGEYRIYTDVRLDTPEIGLGINDHSINLNHIKSVYPNPSTEDFNICFALEEKSSVDITIYDLNGKIVQSVYSGEMPTGEHTFTWNAKNESGIRISKGMYFVELSVNNLKEVDKLIVR